MKRAVALSLLLLGCPAAHVAPYTPKRRVYQPTATAGAVTPVSSSGSLWHAGNTASMLYTDARALREGDLVVVKVEEVANAQRSAATDVNRSNTNSASLTTFLQTLGKTQVSGPGAGLNAGSGTQFQGDASSGRSERLTATVTSVVRQVLPNGNLFVEGHRVILVNSEEHHFYISGVVRPIDIDQDNSIKSSMIADAEIEFTGQGELTDGQRQGILSRYLGWIWPF
jgi:flagellar L-ring protein precursor FlgH